MHYSTSEFKEVSSQDEFAQYGDQIVSVLISGYGRTFTGRLVEISEHFLTLEHRDGRRSKVRRREISMLTPVFEREEA